MYHGNIPTPQRTGGQFSRLKVVILLFLAGQLTGALWGQTRHLPRHSVCSAALQGQQTHTAGECVCVLWICTTKMGMWWTLSAKLRQKLLFFPLPCCQSVPKPPPVPPTKKRKRVIEEPPVVLAPKPLLSGAVPLEAFLATLQKVWNLQTFVGASILAVRKSFFYLSQ